ncbi:hypothetical protein ABZ714_06105 [Streptomyces sp. NPDC006798]|uniref:hypothetical protein n=1 Tax=Streptomyces sp. NPDC006798 TaxID=3155462 RepID=UPI003401BEFC
MTQPDPFQQPPRPSGPPSGQPEYQWGPDSASGTPAYGHPAPGYGYPDPAGNHSPTMPGMPGAPGLPVPAQPATGGGTPLVSIGDITVLPDTIITPSGNMPLRGAVWNAVDMSRTEEKIPAHAIVLAVIFFFACLLGLLFLLMKERKTTGYVQVTVTSGGRHHATMIPARDAMTFQQVMGQVNYARSVSSM